jgi:hypothetical protein
MVKRAKYSRPKNLDAEDILEQTGLFMKDCEEVLSTVAGQSGVPVCEPLPPPLPAPKETITKELVSREESKQDSTILTLCNRHGSALTKSLKGLSQKQKILFFNRIDEVHEDVIATAFSYALQDDISNHQRLIAIRFGIENILAFRKTKDDDADADVCRSSSSVFLNLCVALGGLLTKCVNELSSTERQLFLDKIDDVQENTILIAFSFALETGLTDRERLPLVRKGIRDVIDIQTEPPPEPEEDSEVPAFLAVFDKCGGLIIKYINKLPDPDQDKFFDVITDLDQGAVEKLFGEALQDGLQDMQRAPIIEATINKIISHA